MANKKELTQAERRALASKLKNVSASARKKKIYECKYGLVDGLLKTNKEVGKRFKITGERVRMACKQIEALFTK